MFQLTKEQKLQNLKEILEQKIQKVKNLNLEIENLRKKYERLEKTNP